MAISRIPGYSLISQLDRQGTDLSFVSTTNSGVLGSTLVYMDFTGFTVGVNEANPAQYGQSLVVTGNFLSNAGHILTTSNLQYNLGNVTNQWSSIWAGNIIGSTLTGTLSTAAQHNITSLGTLTSLSLSGNITSSGNLVSSLGNTTTWWNTLYTGTVTATNINGTIQTASQLYIANLGNITVNSISVGGNVVIGGNINGATITANAFIQSGYHVLDANTNISVTGDVVGSGTYSNIAVQLQSSGVTAGTYGNITEMPVITVNSKGLLTNITYIPLATTGNLIFVNTTISSLSNITLSSAANNNIILNTPGTGIV